MRTTNGPYEAGYNSEGQPCVKGPGDGLGYYSATLWPDLPFKHMEDAERAAKIANIAYKQGRLHAQAAIRKSLGIKA